MKCIHLLIILASVITLSLSGPGTSYSDVSFSRLYGSDLGMGIGAKAISMGGAFVSIADDPSATFWNPAGLTQLKKNQAYLSVESPEDFSAVSVIYSPKHSFLKNYNAGFGLSFINRLRFKGDSNDGTWNGNPSHLLDLSMVDAGENYSGKVDSTTHDIRLTAAFSPVFNKNISVGLNYMFIE